MQEACLHGIKGVRALDFLMANIVSLFLLMKPFPYVKVMQGGLLLA
jgi:hypothetical protein